MNDEPQGDDSPAESMEAHRAIARELHLSAQRAYTTGGGAALATVTLLLVLAWWTSQLLSPLPYVASAMLFFVTLFVARRVINRHVRALTSRLEAYCASNDIEFEAFIRYFAARDDYTMLEALLERHGSDSKGNS